MARILYGLCSVGLGHAIRSKIIIDHLSKKHEVFVICSYQSYNYLKKHVKVHKIVGFELEFTNNGINNFRTLFTNAKKFNKKSLDLYLSRKEEILKFNPDYVISDWETFSSLIAKRLNIPLINIDNQHYLIYGKYHFPKKYWFSYFLAWIVLKILIKKADHYIITIFDKCKVKIKRNIHVTEPLIRNSLLKVKPKKGKHILVYQSTKTYDKLLEILKHIDESFIIYGFEKNKKEKNLVFKKFNEDKQFINDLANAKAVITNGGFTLISEAIHLQKPLLVVPIRRHFEQILNALYIEQNNYGEMYEDLTEENVELFLASLNKYKLPQRKQKDNKILLDIIDKVIK